MARKLVFVDEFAKNGLPDPKVWGYETGGHGWGNNELQCYTDRRENARVENGRLIIEARREPFAGKDYTSARILSRAGWRYGRFEVRAKLASGRGTWPALWFLPTSWHTGGKVSWPQDGEIDLMEHVGFDPTVVHQTIHNNAYNHMKGTQKAAQTKVATAMTDFHDYAMEWSEKRMRFFIDNTERFVFEKESASPDVWPFDQPFSFRFNVAVGGNWGGQKGVDDSVFPARMEIESVKVWTL